MTRIFLTGRKIIDILISRLFLAVKKLVKLKMEKLNLILSFI